MKIKKLFFLISTVILILVLFITIFAINQRGKYMNATNFQIRTIPEHSREKNLILSSYNEFLAFFSLCNFHHHTDFEPILLGYNPSFFENNSLAIIVTYVHGDTSYISNIRGIVNNNTITIRYTNRPPRQSMTATITTYDIIVVEIPNHINKIVTRRNRLF